MSDIASSATNVIDTRLYDLENKVMQLTSRSHGHGARRDVSTDVFTSTLKSRVHSCSRLIIPFTSGNISMFYQKFSVDNTHGRLYIRIVPILDSIGMQVLIKRAYLPTPMEYDMNYSLPHAGPLAYTIQIDKHQLKVDVPYFLGIKYTRFNKIHRDENSTADLCKPYNTSHLSSEECVPDTSLPVLRGAYNASWWCSPYLLSVYEQTCAMWDEEQSTWTTSSTACTVMKLYHSFFNFLVHATDRQTDRQIILFDYL